MATLADSFLQDLADLDEDDAENNTTENVEEVPESTLIETHTEDVSDLLSQEDFKELIQKLRKKTEESSLITEGSLSDVLKSNNGGQNKRSQAGSLEDSIEASIEEDEEESKLIKLANEYIAKIDLDILKIYSNIRELYSLKFPELESIVASPLEYISVVLRIKNETDLTLIDLSDILPNTIIMAITVASSMTTGSALGQSEIERITKEATEALELADYRKSILAFLESRMDFIAPNISAIIGSALTARLITHVGSVHNLARMPSQNILNIGIQTNFHKSNTTSSMRGNPIVGGSITSATSATSSIIYCCDIVQMTPPSKRNRALKLVAGKVGLAARIDSFHEAPTGELGVMLRQQILRSLLKVQEPPPAPIRKALPIPDDVPKPRRGGKRYRRAKAKYGMSELRKEANRMIFGPEAEDEVDLEGRLGLGMITKNLGHGKLRLQAKQMKLAEAAAKKRQNALSRVTTENPEGFSSSVIFTPLQGIELCNPSVANSKPKTSDVGYFNTTFIDNVV